jgi:signal transduction histidine kinase
MNLASLLRSRLAMKIGLVGLAQVFVVAIGFITIIRIYRPDPPTLEERLARRAAAREAAELDAEERGFPPPPPPEELRRRFRPPPFDRYLVPLVLIVVGTSTVLLARSLLVPLHKMATAARAFGQGDLAARVGIERRDEIGEVATAFDEMADRVTGALTAERELLANVSHELRTPLARIRVALDLAVEGDAETAREAATDIAEDLDELEGLLRDVLVASRLDLAKTSRGGIPAITPEPLDLTELVENAAGRFRRLFPARTLVVDADAGVATRGDRALLRRAIENLLSNAEKYSEVDEPVHLALHVVEDEARIVIRDGGVGISPEDLKHVFRPFFRVDRSRTKKTGGHGLGLALAQRIVHAHGGTIELKSELGRGTQALVHIPLDRAVAREPTASTPPVDQSSV